MPDMESFKTEIKSSSIKEIRIVPFFNQVPSNPIALTRISVILTSTTKKNDIIRYEEVIGQEGFLFKEKIEELNKKADDFISKIIKDFTSIKVIVKKGIYRYPSEINI